jgi:hypothetical protein
MNLRLSADEFATLIDMVSLAAEASSLNRKPGSEDQLADFERLEDKILARAKEQGFHDIIEIDPDRDKHRITAEYQAGSFIQECLDEMRNEIFWDELSFRLAERDLIKRIGEEKYLNLTEDKRRETLTAEQAAYWDHFAKEGLNHIHLVAPHGQG